MAKKLNKLRSLDEGEIILEDIPEAEVVSWDGDVSATVESVQETENSAEREQEPKDEQVEAKVSTEPARTDELTQADIKWAKANLKGSPDQFDSSTTELLERLVRYGIAADFGTKDGFGRGYKFFMY
jgi:2',3'-cyclic-nucleotide 2'-phosphodiesterase (5'-nucleotidase family)